MTRQGQDPIAVSSFQINLVYSFPPLAENPNPNPIPISIPPNKIYWKGGGGYKGKARRQDQGRAPS